MQERGEYFQPDHWTEYKFPTGEARNPILGVRSSDAEGFCEWLTKREGKWLYRIPFELEAEQYPLKYGAHSPIGYWIRGEVKLVLAWIGLVPHNPRAIDRAEIKNHVKNHNFEGPLYLTADVDFALEYIYTREIGPDIEIVYRDIMDILKQSHNRDIDDAIDRSTQRSLDFRLTLDYFSNRGFMDAFWGLEIRKGRDKKEILDLCIDILTLKDRSTGRSPAFEGIRLVKERVR
jgi:hypothetical protein